MMKRVFRSIVCASALLASSILAAVAPAAETLLSSFEADLTSSAGPSWATDLTHSYVASGVTNGSTALLIWHNTAWTQDFMLAGGALAPIVAASDEFKLDVTTPATTSWRQLFVIMQGAGQGWSQHQFDLAAGATTNVSLDLVGTGIKANAAAGDMSWWEILLVFQGGDDPAVAPITTTIDNLRFAAVPEPAAGTAAGLALLGFGAMTRRRSR